MAYWTRGLSLVQSPRAVCCAGLQYECGPWPVQKNAGRAGRVAVGKRSHDRPKDICGARSRIYGVDGAVASSNASSGATRFDCAYGKYWRRELPGLKPVRQWKIGQARARDCTRLAAGAARAQAGPPAENAIWPRRRERSATHHSPSPGAALCKQRRAAIQVSVPPSAGGRARPAGCIGQGQRAPSSLINMHALTTIIKTGGMLASPGAAPRLYRPRRRRRARSQLGRWRG